VYPLGVTGAQTSRRVKGLAVMLYLLGLSYGATSLALEALGVFMSKASVWSLSRLPAIVVMQTTQYRARDERSTLGCLGPSH
jgi:hypothetical protein